jgi:metallo-beta-lactamase class B
MFIPSAPPSKSTCLGMALLLSGLLMAAPARAEPPVGCSSQELLARFEDFGRTGKMPPDLGQWLGMPQAQYIEPYRAFDNVYFVGICWVSAWIVTTSQGAVLIDTLHEPHVEQLVANIRKVGVDLADIKYVLMTHGHFDHAGGAYRLQPLLPNAKFVMTQTGWNEAIESAKQSEATPRPWKMIAQDQVAKDGDVIRVGDAAFEVYETPGHTYGTASYGFDVKDGARSYHAVTIGGLGLNAIKDSKQVEAYIASVKRLEKLAKDTDKPVTVHLTTHPFSTGLTEASQRIAGRAPDAPHPLVDPAGLIRQLDQLREGAEERLVVEQKAGR